MNLTKINTQLLIVVILIIAVVGSLAYAILARSTYNPSAVINNNIQSESNVIPDGNKINIADKTTLQFNSKTVQLSSGWEILEASIGLKLDDIYCQKECLIYKVGKEDQVFYVSNKLINSGSFNVSDAEKDLMINVNSNTYNLNYYQSYKIVYNPQADTDILGEFFEYKRQLYGCLVADICISSGNVDLSVAVSKTDIEIKTQTALQSLEDLINSLHY